MGEGGGCLFGRQTLNLLGHQKRCQDYVNVFAVVSTTNPARMEQNILAALNPLTEEEVRWLENG